MEKIYRGYPQNFPGNPVGHTREMPMRDIPYNVEKPIANTPWNKRQFRRENEYLKGLYPASVRRSQVLIDEWFDHYERPGSPLYDEYPDREWILRTRDRIWNQAKETGMEPSPELLYVLLISEIGRRRTAGRLR